MSSEAIGKSSVEDLYKAFGVLADAKDKAGEHESEFQSFIAATKGNSGEKRLGSQFICRFFKFFPKAQDDAIQALFELCEDEDAGIRKQALKDIPSLCRGCPEKTQRFSDALSMLLGTDDVQEVSSIQTSLYSLFSINMKGAMEGIFTRLLQTGEEDDEVLALIRERLLKFLVAKVKQCDDLDKDTEDYIMEQAKKLLEDVTKDEFIAVMELLRSLKTMATVQSRQQLVEMVVDQAALDEPFEASDPDCIDRLLHCIKSAAPMFSKNVHSKQFVGYVCDHVLPVLKSVVGPDEETNVQLDLLKVFAELCEFCGDLDKLESRVGTIFSALLEHMPLPPKEENADASNSEDPKLNYSQVECLMFAFHQVARKLPGFLTDESNAERLKDFRIRLQYMALSSQICTKRLKEALQGKTGEALRTDENKKRVVALKLFTNITVLVKDLMHNPPAYKVAVTLSWRPTRQEPKAAEANENSVKSPTGTKRNITPITYEGSDGRRGGKQSRTLYQPPSGKFSEKAGTYNSNGNSNNSYGNYNNNNRGYRGGYRGGQRGGFRGQGFRGRRGAPRGGGADTGFYQNKLS